MKVFLQNGPILSKTCDFSIFLKSFTPRALAPVVVEIEILTWGLLQMKDKFLGQVNYEYRFFGFPSGKCRKIKKQKFDLS